MARTSSEPTVCSTCSGSSMPSIAARRLGQALALIVLHRPHAAPVRAGHERVPHVQRAALDEQGDDRAAAGIELGLDDHAAGLDLRVGLELLELGDDEDR